MTEDDLRRRLIAAGFSVPPSGLFRARMTADILGIHMRTLEERRVAGKPPRARRLKGGGWHYDIRDLAEYLSGDDE